MVTARIQQAPPDHKGGYDLEVDQFQATADDYDSAVADINSRVPEGWRVISLMVDRD